MSKTILISINTSWNIFNFRRELIESLKNQGYRIVTAAPNDGYTPKLQEIVDRHIHLPMQGDGTSLLGELKLIYRYIQLLREVKPAVMLTYTIKPNIYGSFAARLLGVPIINNVSGLGTAFIRNNWLTFLVKRLYRAAFQRSACVFFQNSEDRDLFIRLKLVMPAKAALIPGSGVDLDFFSPAVRAPKEAEAPISFVLIARMLWDKGIGEFVDAARIVKAKFPRTVFRLVGPQGIQNKTAISEATIQAWVDEGVVEYLGETNTVRDVIAAHDCIVLPSYREGMSRVLLEAAAMGKPLIATDVPGCRQIVEDTKNGLLCKVQDVEDLARAIIVFLNLSPKQRAEMGAESRAKAVREFDQKLVIDAYQQKIRMLSV